MARIPYPDPDALSERTRAALDRVPELNVFRMLAHADLALPRFLRLTGGLWVDAELSPRRRELAILLVSRLCQADYEWKQHVPIARRSGVSDEEIEGIAEQRLDGSVFGAEDAALLNLVTAIVRETRCDDETFAAVRAQLSSRELVELHLVVGIYVSLARLMTNLELELDEPAAAALLDRD